MQFIKFVLGVIGTIVAFVVAVKLLGVLLALVGVVLKLVWLAVIIGAICFIAWLLYKVFAPEGAVLN